MTHRRPRWANAGLLYAVAALLGTVAFFTAFILFLGNLPKLSRPWLEPSADVGPPALFPAFALLSNAVLLTLFSLQHSLMARPSVKAVITRFVPAALERATYVHAANLAGFLVILLWQPVPVVLWHVDNDVLKTIIWIGFAAGWLILFAAAFSMNLFELLGVRQAWHWSRGREAPPLTLKTSWLYRYMEHPMYVGVVLGFWMAPTMTIGHAALAAQFTLYIAIAMDYERRDLRSRFGKHYDHWRTGHGLHDEPIRVPASARGVAAELSRRYRPVISEPLPIDMRNVLQRL